MRPNVLIGSALGVVLLGAAAAIVFQQRGITTGREVAQPKTAAVSNAPVLPAASEPAAANRVAQPPALAPPSFDIVKVGPDGTAVIAGRAEPGSKVIVRDGDKVVGEVTADHRGEWVLVPEKPMSAGDRLLSLEASNRQDGAVVKSDETVALSISPSAAGKGETALAVVLPREGGGVARVLQRPDAGARTPADLAQANKQNPLSMDSVEYDAQGRIALSGRAPPNATVQIYLGNQPLATVTADASGEWTAKSSGPVGREHLELRLDQIGEDGRVAQRVALPLVRAAAVELAPGRNYTVHRGNSLWQIARQTYGSGVRYLVIYSANLAQIHDPERIYPGQVFKIPKS